MAISKIETNIDNFVVSVTIIDEDGDEATAKEDLMIHIAGDTKPANVARATICAVNLALFQAEMFLDANK